jgi:hypothetical protein
MALQKFRHNFDTHAKPEKLRRSKKLEVSVSYYPPSAYSSYVGRALARWRKEFPRYTMSHPCDADALSSKRYFEILEEERRKVHING